MWSLDCSAWLVLFRNADPLQITAAIGTFSLLGWITLVLRSNYLRWKAIGPGGVPRNPYGWVLQWLLDLVLGHRDTTYLLYFDLKLARMKGMTKEDRDLAQRRFLEDLPLRKAPKARAAPFAVPQRQEMQRTGLHMIEVLLDLNFSFDRGPKLRLICGPADRVLGTTQDVPQHSRGQQRPCCSRHVPTRAA